MEDNNAKEIPAKPTSAILPAPKKDKKSETTSQDTPEVDSRSSLTDSDVKLEGVLSTTVTDKPQSDNELPKKDKKSGTTSQDTPEVDSRSSLTDSDVKLEGVLSTTITDKPQSDDELPKKDKKSGTTSQHTPEVDSRSSLTDSDVKLEGTLSTTDKPQSDDHQLKEAMALSLSDTSHDGVKLEDAAAVTTTDKPRCDDGDTLQATIVSVTNTDQTGGGAKLEGATALSARDEPRCDDKKLVDQIKGVLYGNCIGDAIGLLTEFMDKNEAQKHYGGKRVMKLFYRKDLEYNQKVADLHRCNWKEGDWTDDSDQMILILRTLVQNGGKFVEKDFAKKLRHWVRHGYEELGDTRGCGLGRTTASVLSHRDFLENPHKAAKDVWEGSGRYIAPNGGVMRTSVLGTMEFRDLDKVIENTRSACMVTHADPRCIASCVAVTIAIALMLQRKHNKGKHDIDAIMSTAHWYAEQELKETPQYKDELKHHMFAESLDKLELDSPQAIGYTFKCMGAGFWAFRQKDFREAIQAITMEAGDADTNCAVAGALLGCKVGFHKLPKSWVNGLCNRGWLDKEIKSYFTLLGLQH
ncbi:Hypothetical predicted protein [Paramuricea clavata]|uniref:Uncharacterized protein n=1 Tax=Paramuricea clavata TaxID=317549 RepID=A0A6S7FNJ4_PARCT|nr:Hypothetical predicted protein [Paramuricea clavata]